MANPPALGRARLRGECVRRFHAQPGDYCCDWTGVWDVRNRRRLDLSDPFAAEEKWTECATPDMPWELPFRFALRESADASAHVREALAHARSLYDQGRYEEAYRNLDRVRPMRESFNADGRRDFLRLSAWVQTRRGFLDAPAILAELGPDEEPPLWLINDYAFVFRFGGLAPSPELTVWLRKGEDRLRQGPAEAPDTVAAFREHQGYALLMEGQMRKAARVLKQACQVLRRQRRKCPHRMPQPGDARRGAPPDGRRRAAKHSWTKPSPTKWSIISAATWPTFRSPAWLNCRPIRHVPGRSSPTARQSRWRRPTASANPGRCYWKPDSPPRPIKQPR